MKKSLFIFALLFAASAAFVFAEERAIKIVVGKTELEGVVYDTELAKEILEKFPLTVLMVGYGGREYYGAIPFTPKSADGGQLRFDDGDITYCATNNTLAIFYAQISRPNLTMKVIPIGRVTSDLSVFGKFNARENISFVLSDSAQERKNKSKLGGSK